VYDPIEGLAFSRKQLVEIYNYPKEPEKNIKFRTLLLSEAHKNAEVRLLLNQICAKDRLYWINCFVWTYDPRTPDKHLPFCTWPFQDETIAWDAKCCEDQEDNIVKKTRDMGATWIFVVNDLYDWLYHPQRIEIRWGSRKEDYVDLRGDMDSIFEKFRYILSYLPMWMLPQGYDPKKHDAKMKLINPVTKSVISGESTNENFGRGGRKYKIRFDEFAFWDIDVKAWEGAADATNFRTALSTPNGSSNKFAQLANEGEIKINAIELHWTRHPNKCKGAYYLDAGRQIPIKDWTKAYGIWKKYRGVLAPAPMKGGMVRSDWYDAECERRDGKSIAQELDIDFLSSGYPFFDLRKIDDQRVWKHVSRKSPYDEIEYGTFIKANLILMDHKVEMRETHSGWLRIYEMPKVNAQYVASADTSEGLPKGDESFLVVRDKLTRNVVAVANGLWAPEDFSHKIQRSAQYYHGALTAVENNNHGYSVCRDLQEMDCNLYFTKKYSPKGKKIGIRKAGWTTTGFSRPLALDQLREEIDGGIELRDKVIIAQCKTFIVKDNGKPEADGSFKDDGVMATAFGSFVIQEHPWKKKKIKRQYENTRVQNAGFGF